LVESKHYIKQIDFSKIYQILKELNVKIWYENPTNLFDGYLKWQGDEILKGYINHQNGIPKNSVGFWKLDKDLYLDKNLEVVLIFNFYSNIMNNESHRRTF